MRAVYEQMVATNGMLSITGSFPSADANWGGTRIGPVEPKTIQDGISHALLIGEACKDTAIDTTSIPKFDPWVRGMFSGPITDSGANNYTKMSKDIVFAINAPSAPFSANRIPLSSNYSGEAHFTLADSAVTFVNEDVDLLTYRSLATRNGTENVSVPLSCSASRITKCEYQFDLYLVFR